MCAVASIEGPHKHEVPNKDFARAHSDFIGGIGLLNIVHHASAEDNFGRNRGILDHAQEIKAIQRGIVSGTIDCRKSFRGFQ